MIDIRRSSDRGHFNHRWLESRHTFSFADDYDPSRMGFGPLRVIKQDTMEPRIENEAAVKLTQAEETEVLLFDLP